MCFTMRTLRGAIGGLVLGGCSLSAGAIGAPPAGAAPNVPSAETPPAPASTAKPEATNDEEPEGNQYARARLISGATGVRPGDTLEVAVTFDISPEWYMYWPGQNDSGVPATVAWSAPAGVRVGDLRWPAPTRKVLDGDLLDYIYLKRLTLVAPVTLPSDARGTITLNADVEWLVCKDACLPGRARLTIEIPVAEAAGLPSSDAPLIADARSHWPQPLPASSAELSYAWREGAWRVRAPGAVRLAFFPHEAGATLQEPLARGQREGNELELHFAPLKGATPRSSPGSNPGVPVGSRILGVLQVTREGGKVEHFDVNLPMADQGTNDPGNPR